MRGAPFAVLLVAAVLLTVSALRWDFPWVNHDVAVYLHTADAVLDGRELYVDWIETNPPAAHLITLLVVAPARWLGVSTVLAYHLAVIALGALGVLVLRRAAPADRPVADQTLIELAYTYVAVAASPTPVDFGQREHLFVLVLLPFVILRLASGVPKSWLRPMAVLVGFMAAMKPQFVVLLMMVEFLAIWWRGVDGQPDPAGRAGALGWIVLGGLLPLGWLAVLSTDSLQGLLGTVVPFHASGAYGAMDRPLAELLARPAHTVLVVVAVAAVLIGFVARRRGVVSGRRSTLVTGLILVAYVALVHQHKFFSYHLVPVFGISVFFGASFLVALSRSGVRPPMGALARRALGLLLVAGTGIALLPRYVDARNEHGSLATDLAALVERGDSVHFVSVGLDPIYAPFHLQLRCTNLWAHDVVLPALMVGDDERARATALDAHADALRERIRERRPLWVLVEPYQRPYLRDRSPYELLVADREAVPLDLYAPVADDELPQTQGWLDGWHVYRRR